MSTEILRSIGNNPLRTLLTALGVMIGVASVIANLALGRGARENVDRSLRHLGSDAMQVSARIKLEQGEMVAVGRFLSYEDGLALADLREHITRVDMSSSGSARARAGRNIKDTRFTGGSPSHLEALAGSNQLQPLGWRDDQILDAAAFVSLGRMFTRDEVDEAAAVCVIGHKHAADLYGGPEAALGQLLLLNRLRCTVIGVLAELEFVDPAQRLAGEPNELLLLPISSAINSMFARPPNLNLTVRVRDERQIGLARAAIERLLRERHNIKTRELRGPDGVLNLVHDDDFSITTRQDLLGAQIESARTFSVLLAALAAVSLGVGGIGIMNVMLASVVERTTEIGVRRAVGATRAHIVQQFLFEAMLISALGGALGVALGLLMIPLAGSLNRGIAVLDLSSLPLAFGVALATGMLFGLYPAARAAALRPIDALRHE